jgi:hypothetical protein
MLCGRNEFQGHKNSPYARKLDNLGLFLQALQYVGSHAPGQLVGPFSSPIHRAVIPSVVIDGQLGATIEGRILP